MQRVSEQEQCVQSTVDLLRCNRCGCSFAGGLQSSWRLALNELELWLVRRAGGKGWTGRQRGAVVHVRM